MFRLILLYFITFFGCSSLQAGALDNIVKAFKGPSKFTKRPFIRILVKHDIEKASVEVSGKYSLYDPYDGSHISSRFIGKRRELEQVNDGIKWGESFPGLYQLKIKLDEPGFICVDSHCYRNAIDIYDIGRTISIVNEQLLEGFVLDNLSQFSDRNLHSEVLAALAIAVRTNAYFAVLNPKNPYWTVNASIIGYEGIQPVSFDVSEAVYSTKEMIMSHTGIYDRKSTPFPLQFDAISPFVYSKDWKTAKISLSEANAMAEKGAHAAQILSAAFPEASIMLIQ